MSVETMARESKSYHTLVRDEDAEGKREFDEGLVHKLIEFTENLWPDEELMQIDWDDPEDVASVGKVILIAAFEHVLGSELSPSDCVSLEEHWEPGVLSIAAARAMFDSEMTPGVAQLYNAAFAQVRKHSTLLQVEQASQVEIDRMLLHDEMEGIVLGAMSAAIREVEDRQRYACRTPTPARLPGRS